MVSMWQAWMPSKDSQHRKTFHMNSGNMPVILQAGALTNVCWPNDIIKQHIKQKLKSKTLKLLQITDKMNL